MKPTINKLEKRIAALEAEVAALKARPEQHIHYHSGPVYQPVLPVNPLLNPWLPGFPPIVTCGSAMMGDTSSAHIPELLS